MMAMNSMETPDIINKIKEYFNEENIKKQNIVKQFSDDVITMAYQKISENLTDQIQQEDDPLVLIELLGRYLEIGKLIDERGLARQQVLLKLFEQLNKYEQSRYY